VASDHNENGEGSTRRKVLECMTWAGTGILWTVSGGVPKSLSLLGSAEAATAATQSFTFAQISDSHVGFHVKPVNPDALGTLKEAIAKVGALPTKPAFMIHTGDITHLSTPEQFDDAAQVIGTSGLDVHYVPGEHDLIDETPGKFYLERYGKATRLARRRCEGPLRIYAYRRLRSYSAVDDLQGLGLGHRRCRAGIVDPQTVWFGDGAQRSYSSSHTEGGGQHVIPHRAVDGLSAAGARSGCCAGADGRSG
jgi:hypothetical protein